MARFGHLDSFGAFCSEGKGSSLRDDRITIPRSLHPFVLIYINFV